MHMISLLELFPKAQWAGARAQTGPGPNGQGPKLAWDHMSPSPNVPGPRRTFQGTDWAKAQIGSES